MTISIRALLCLVALFCVISFGLDTKQEQIFALESTLAELKTHYGMAKFKSEVFGVTLESVREKYTHLIQTATMLEEHEGLVERSARQVLSPDEFRQLLIGLANEFHDGHTNVLRQSNKAWTLGLSAAGIGGRLLVTAFDRNYFAAEMTFPQLEIGDEIVAFDGIPVAVLARRRMLYTQMATFESRRHRALEQLHFISHRWQLPKKDGEAVKVTFAKTDKNGGRQQTFDATLHWIPTQDLEVVRGLNRYLPSEPAPKIAKRPYAYGDTGSFDTYFSHGLKKMALPRGTVMNVGKAFNTEIKEANEAAEKKEPHDAALKDLKPNERLAVYTVRHKGKNLAVIRIPDYSPGSIEAAIQEIKWLYAIIGILENSTDGLIIDQLSNGGGFVYHFAHFLRMFAGKAPIKIGTMDTKLSETLLRTYDRIGTPDGDNFKKLEGHARNFGQVLLDHNTIKELRARFERGEQWSGPVSFYEGSVDFAEGEEAEMVGKKGSIYTKPVIILNDQRSASGGDFMPATLQANQRAIVFGETSAGLGGPVYRSQESMPGSEMFMRCTSGFCVRADGLPIENLGVIPDIERRIEPKDLKEGFVSYAREALDAAVQWANGRKVTNIEMAKSKGVTPSPLSPLWNRRVAQLREVVDQTSDVHELASLYASFFKGLSPEELDEVSKEDSTRLPLPLPHALVYRESLLGALTQRDEVIDRLKQMALLPRFAGAEYQALIDTLVEGLQKLGPVVFERCMERLARHGVPKKVKTL